MREFVRRAAVMTGFLLLSSAGPALPGDFRVDLLGEGVHLFRPADDAPSRTNSLVVERRDGLLVVAAQPTPDAARELIAEIDKRLPGTIRYLVLPHSHAEAAGGASAFGSDVLRIASRKFRDALADPAYDYGAESRARATAPTGWIAPPRPSPTLLLEARALLADPRNEVALVPYGNRHSAGDLVVRVPGADVTFGGALLFPDGGPYAGDASTDGLIGALNHFLRDSPRWLVPMRGPALDRAAVRHQRDALAWLRARANDLMADRLPYDEIRERILASEALGSHFTPDSPFLAGFVDHTIQEIVADLRKRGLLLPPRTRE